MLTRQNLGAQLRAANLGWSAAIEPVPKTGRVRFNQIGNLSNLRHTGEPGIDLSKQKYQQMIGNLTPVTPIDPAAWRGAIWYMGTKINKGLDQPPPNPDSWSEQFIRLWDGALSSTTYDEEKNAMFVQSQTPDAYTQVTSTALVYYVGKIPAGTRVKVSCDLRGQNDNQYGQPLYLHVRGWPNGWFGTDPNAAVQHKQYLTFQHSTAKGYGKWFDYADEFDVMSEYQDVWLALEVTCNDPSRYPRSFNMGWVRNLKVELA